MNKKSRPRIQSEVQAGGSCPPYMAALHTDQASAATDACRAVPDVNAQIDIWVNEGGAGGEVDR